MAGLEEMMWSLHNGPLMRSHRKKGLETSTTAIENGRFQQINTHKKVGHIACILLQSNEKMAAQKNSPLFNGRPMAKQDRSPSFQRYWKLHFLWTMCIISNLDTQNLANGFPKIRVKKKHNPSSIGWCIKCMKHKIDIAVVYFWMYFVKKEKKTEYRSVFCLSLRLSQFR